MINIIEDTRNQIGKHKFKENYFKFNDVNVLRTKLPFGDYAVYGDFTLVVDTKKDVLEIEGNLTKDHQRFKREIIGANKLNTGIVILIEEKEQYRNIDDFVSKYKIPVYKSIGFKTINGQKKLSHYKGQKMANFNVETIGKIMKTMQEKYAVLFEFTTPQNCGKKIVDILYNDRDKYKQYFNNKLKNIILD